MRIKRKLETLGTWHFDRLETVSPYKSCGFSGAQGVRHQSEDVRHLGTRPRRRRAQRSFGPRLIMGAISSRKPCCSNAMVFTSACKATKRKASVVDSECATFKVPVGWGHLMAEPNKTGNRRYPKTQGRLLVLRRNTRRARCSFGDTESPHQPSL